jgi:dipeptidyl aminopeptidase/acylaminoacyl peptidase
MTPSRAIAALFLALCLAVGSAAEASAKVPFETFAAEPAMLTPRISPNGKHVAVGTREGKQMFVLMYDIDAQQETLKAFSIPADVEVDWVDWANDDRLLIGLSKPSTERWMGTTYDTTISRVIAVNRGGGNVTVLFANARKFRTTRDLSGILHRLPDDPKAVLMAATGKDDKFNVYRVNVDDGRAELVQRGNVHTVEWLTDRAGVPRIRWDYRPRRDRIEAYARKGDSEDWDQIASYGAKDFPELNIEGFTDDPNVAIAVSRQTDRYALYEYNLTTRTLGKPLYQHATVDVGDPVGGPLYDLHTAKLAGVYYVDDVFQSHYFDPVLADVQGRLDATFSESAIIRISSWSQDRARFVINTQGPKDPGSYYLFDATKNHASLIGRAKPDIGPAELGDMLIIKYKTRDGAKVPGYLTLPPGKGDKKLPLVVMPHGGPEARDFVQYDTWAQALANRGYAVFQPNFRGSGGYGKAYAEKGYRQWGRLMQDDVTDGVKALVSDGTVDPNRICIAGASYGGYASLAGGAFTPDLYKCVVAIAAVTDLPAFIETREEQIGSESSVFTYWLKLLGNPKSDLADMTAVSPALQAQNFKVPVLLVHGDNDTNVPIDQSKRMDAALRKAGKQVQFVTIDGEGHNFRKPTSNVTLLTEMEKFLAAHIGN